MKRRNFLKTMLGAAVAAALPGCRLPTGPNESVHIGIDPAEPGTDESIVTRWGVDDAGGGYMYSDELSEQLLHELQPINKYRRHINAGGEIGKVDGFQYFESVRFIESTPEGRADYWHYLQAKHTGMWQPVMWDKPPFERESVEYNGFLLTRKQYDNLGKAMAEHNSELDRAMIEGMRDAARQLDIGHA